MKPFWGLRSRLLGGLSVLVVVAVASSGWVALRVARGEMQSAQEAHALAFGRQVAELIARAVGPGEQLVDSNTMTTVKRMTESLLRIHGVLEIVVIDSRGLAILGVVPEDPFLWGSPRLGGLVSRRDGDALFVYSPIASEQGSFGTVRVKLSGEDELSAVIARAGFVLTALTGFNVSLVLLFGAVFVRRVVRPIEALATQAERVAAGQIDLPPIAINESGGQDEVTHLTSAFNRMTSSLREQRETLVAQEKLATVGRLAAGVAHEVGNPLTAILGYADLLLSEPAPADDAEAASRRDSLDRIRKETTRISAIIADLLDYSRPLAGSIEPVRIADIVEQSHSLMRPQTRFRGVELRTEIPADLPAARGSASRLQQVFVNLLFNAADAMDGEGIVTVRARADQDEVVVTVSDTGPGISRADRDKIFDPFFTTKEPGKGTGLGLAISLSIMDALSGTLRLVDSPDGKGATFELRLPLAG